jgi:hypothetical protein
MNRERKKRLPINRPARQSRQDYQGQGGQGQNRGPRQYQQNHHNQHNQNNQNQNQPTAKLDYSMFTKAGGLVGIPKITPGLKPTFVQPPMGGIKPLMGGITPPPMGAMGINVPI